MNQNKRKSVVIFVVILNLVLLTLCGWAFWKMFQYAEAPAVSSEGASIESSAGSASTAEVSENLPEASQTTAGIFGDYYEEAQKILDSMTNSEKLGQLLLTRVPDKEVFSAIETYQPAGFVLFSKDFEVLKHLSSDHFLM